MDTKIHLPPGRISEDVQAALIDLLFGEDPIFKPNKYGRIDGDEVLESADPQEVLRAFWAKSGRLTVVGKPRTHFVTISPNRREELTWTSSISWCAPANAADEKWKKKHLEKVVAAMRLLGSPLACAATDEDLESKCWHWRDEPFGGQIKLPTLAPPVEGIPGMFWRVFVDQRFSSMMDLNDLPPSQFQKIGEICVLSPYDDPLLAGSVAGQAMEKELIHKVGKDLFLLDGRRPTRVPEL